MKKMIFFSLLAFSMMAATTACTSNNSQVGTSASTPPCGSGKCAATGKCGGKAQCGGAGKCGSLSGGI